MVLILVLLVVVCDCGLVICDCRLVVGLVPVALVQHDALRRERVPVAMPMSVLWPRHNHHEGKSKADDLWNN